MQMRMMITLVSALALGACSQSPSIPKDDKEKFSYAVGHQIGSRLKQDKVDIDAKMLGQAIQDVINGSPLKLTEEEMRGAMMAYQQKRMEEMQATADQNLKAGEEFLAENKKKEGIVTTKSGLQYKVLTEGKGRKPKETDTVVAHYRGTLINGTEFDSSIARGEPATFPVNGVIPGWQEALKLMPEGSKWQVFIPANLAYGQRGAGESIGPNETLVFDIELIKVK